MWNGVLQEKVVAEASVVTKVLPTTGSGVMQKYTHIEVDSSKFNTPKGYPGFVFTIRDAEMFSTLAHINETCWASGSNFMTSSVLVEYMRDIDDWPAWVSAYADTVTNTIRTTGYQTISQSRFTGTALISEPFIVVRWYWLIYPAVILLLALCLQIWVVYKTATADVPAWKNNPLPLLYADTDEDQRTACRNESSVMHGRIVLDVPRRH